MVYKQITMLTGVGYTDSYRREGLAIIQYICLGRVSLSLTLTGFSLVFGKK